jgi:hypothetical protein
MYVAFVRRADRRHGADLRVRRALRITAGHRQKRATMRVLLRSSPSPISRAVPPRRGPARILLISLALSLSACGDSPDRKARDTVDSVRSWTATMRLAGDAWLRGKAPTVYARKTFEKAGETLRQEFQTLQGDGVPPALRPELGRLRAPADAAGRLARAVARGDRTAVRNELGGLAIEDAGLAALSKRLPGTGR